MRHCIGRASLDRHSEALRQFGVAKHDALHEE